MPKKHVNGRAARPPAERESKVCPVCGLPFSWRRKWARIIPVADVLDDRVEPDFADRHAERQALNARLDRLPSRQRAVLVLRFYEGLGDDDIARVLDCSPGTVRSHASRALATLRVDAPTTEHTLRPAHKEI